MFSPAETPTASFPYRIEKKIGEGAMGSVYRAIEPDLNRVVAIKTLRPHVLEGRSPEIVQEARQRFLQEARAAAALAHSGVATIYRVGEEAGTPYIAMEWLDGVPLDAKIEESGPLTIQDAARLVVELLNTLETAHRAGVVHRDIKPSNLMLLANGRLKVTDFGIARVQGSDLITTQAGLVLGTPKFASPEQLRSEAVDGRSDLFSTGVVLYYLLSGRFPFEGETFMDVANAILQKEPTPIHELVPKIPTPLAAALNRTLHKNRDQRFSTATEMAQALALFTTSAGASSGGAAGASWSDFNTADTAQVAATAGGPPLLDLPLKPAETVVATVQRWPGRSLGRQETQALLERLQEQPLHAPPFAGGVLIGSTCLLIEGGLILGAIDPVLAPDASGDEVIEQLPEAAEAVLHPLPESLPSGVVTVLTSLLYPPQVRHSGLDSSFVHLPALAEKLKSESFSGLLRLQRGDGTGYLLFDRGQLALHLFTTGWSDVDVARPWESWVSEVPIRASVEESRVVPSEFSLRRQFRGLNFDIFQIDPRTEKRQAPVDRTSLAMRLLRQTSSGSLGTSVAFQISPVPTSPTASDLYSADPVYRFLSWSLDSLPEYFREREKANRWKYLVSWIYLIRRATLHEDLERPDVGRTDFFDLVTRDDAGKVLHLGHRVARGTKAALEDFRQRVIDAKTARRKTGDVGGAFLISPKFDADTLDLYREMTKPEKSSGWFGMEETFTGYEGFVRIGPRRGFHLLLVEEKDDGFQPVLPA